MKFETYAANLARIRTSKSISAYELSLRIGKDVSYIYKVESGKINISLKTMIAISEELNTPLTDFFAE